MKKLLVIVLALAMVFCMFSCGKEEPKDEFNWPTQPVTFVVPYAIAGGTGTMSKILADGLSEKWGVAVTCVEKSGGSGVVGTSELVTGKADGYTLSLTCYGPVCLSPNLGAAPYTLADLQPIVQVSSSPSLISVCPKYSKFEKFEDLLAAAKAAPGTITYSTSGANSAHNIAIAALSIELANDVNLFKHLPESGGAASVTQTIGGHYDFVGGISSEQAGYFGEAANAQGMGLKCLLQMTDAKAADTPFPDAPTCGDLGYKTTGGTWYIVFCKAGTDERIVKKVATDVIDVMNNGGADLFVKANQVVDVLDHEATVAKVKAQYEAAKDAVAAIKAAS